MYSSWSPSCCWKSPSDLRKSILKILKRVSDSISIVRQSTEGEESYNDHIEKKEVPSWSLVLCGDGAPVSIEGFKREGKQSQGRDNIRLGWSRWEMTKTDLRRQFNQDHHHHHHHHHHHPPHLHHHHHDHECSADRVQQVKEMEALSPDRKLRRRLNDWSSHHLVLVQHGWQINHKIWKSKCWEYFSFLLVWIKQSSAAYLFSSVRSSNSDPNLLLIHHPQSPTFQIHTGPQYWTSTFWATTAI